MPRRVGNLLSMAALSAVAIATPTIAGLQPTGSQPQLSGSARITGRVRIDRFELTGLRGPMVLSAEVGAGALLSIQRGGEEIAVKTLDFVGTETMDHVVVASLHKWRRSM